MKVSRIVWRQTLGLAATVGLLLGPSAQAANVPSLVTQPVNNARRVILKGNVHPLARPEYDRGLAPDSLPMDQMLLVLKRSKEQQAALDKLLVGQQEKSSPEYHHWLTPQEFGNEFGPSASDIQAVTDWLTSEGFQVNHVANGRTVIEFTGTAGLVRQVFYTEIHKYVIKGKSYWANASNPQIPAALAPVVKGIASLNNFPRKPMDRPVGVFSRSKTTGKIKALYTFGCPSGSSCAGRPFYALGPADFATIYNVLPLWNSSPAIDGTGETIAIVSDSNIKPQDVANFRIMFGLAPNPVNVILNGPDPGLIPNSETEADADAEWAGAVATNATIDLVVSEDTETSAGVDLSALYIVDNNLAPVLSESYGNCESSLGNAGNAFENAMWQQAAAEGITVVVAGGDSGSAGCDDPNQENAAKSGLAVSGSASTPYNVAVGGTDFDKPSSYFSTTNDSTTQASAKSYVPEITWNNSCARSGLTTDCSTLSSSGQDLVAGGGGESNCAVEDSSGSCSAGYPKPVWQTGKGVPADSVRDIPDVSLFASNGFDNAFYVVCASDETDFESAGSASCSGDISTIDFLGLGGTSLSTPAFAGIMALVNQKTGQRQGNANFVLYPLAAAAAKNNNDCTSNADAVSNTSCIFYDITQGHNSSGTAITPGNNSVACVAGSPDCDAPTGYSDGILVQPGSSSSPAWTTSAGYDLATGLGSVNVANLVDNWGSVSFHSSATTLSLTPTTLTHGQSVTAGISVTSTAGTPTGDVELMGNPQTATNPAGTNNIGIADFTLGSGGTVSGTTDMLPGGTYNVFAHYAGDGTSGSSDSAPVQVTVNPEGSMTTVSLVTFNLITGQVASSNATTAAYGSPYVLRTDVLNASGDPCAPNGIPQFTCPTGTVSLTANGQSLDQGSYALNSLGYAEDQPIQFAGGAYSLVGNYSGDNDYNPSTSPAKAITITKAVTTTTAAPPTQTSSASVSFTVTVNTQSNGAGPTGTVQVYNGSTPMGNPATCQGVAATSTTFALCQATATITLTAKTTLTVEYGGDGNYASSTSGPFTIGVVIPTSAALTVNPSGTVKPGSTVTLSAVVTSSQNGGPAPTGTMKFYNGGTLISGTPSYTATAGTSSAPATLTATLATSFASQATVTAAYSGDNNYGASTSPPVSIPITSNPDFSMSTNQTKESVKAGSTASYSVTVTPEGGFNQTVALACSGAPSLATCSVTPASVTLDGTNAQDAKVTVTTTAPSLVPPAPPGEPPAGRWPLGLWVGLIGMLGLAALAWSWTRGGTALPPSLRLSGSPRGSSKLRWGLLMFATILLGAALCGSCGGGGSSTGGGTGSGSNPGTPVGTYTLTVKGTSGNLTHSVTTTLSVQ